jgi:hypothetical protein
MADHNVRKLTGSISMFRGLTMGQLLPHLSDWRVSFDLAFAEVQDWTCPYSVHDRLV